MKPALLACLFALCCAACGDATVETNTGPSVNTGAANAGAPNSGSPSDDGMTDAACDLKIEAALEYVVTNYRRRMVDHYNDVGVVLTPDIQRQISDDITTNTKAVHDRLLDKHIEPEREGYRSFIRKRSDLPDSELQRLLVAKLVDGITFRTPDGEPFVIE